MKKTLLLSLVAIATQVPINLFAQNVGIGVASPQEKLHIDGSLRGNQSGAVRISTGHGYVDIGPRNSGWSHFQTDRDRYYFNKGITIDQGLIGSYNQDLQLQTSGTTRITALNSNGNVGIGTASPSANLDVAGRTSKFSNTYPKYRWWFGGGTDLNWKTIANVNLPTGFYKAVAFEVIITNAGSNYGSSADAEKMTFYVSMRRSSNAQDNYNDAIVKGPSTDYVRAVKTSTGVYELQVRQAINYRHMTVEAQVISELSSTVSYVDNPTNGSTGGTTYISSGGTYDDGYWTKSGSDLYNTDQGDNVGIGTTSPSYKMDVNGDIRAQDRVYVGTGGGSFYNDNGSRVRIDQDFYTNNANTYLYGNNTYLGNSSGDNIHMRANNFSWTGGSGGIINSAGNVGIGTSSPTYELDVKGDVFADGGWLRVSGNQGLYFETHEGGWYMSDNTWIRTYNNKSIYQNTGTMRTDGTFQVGGSGSTLNVPNGGNFAYRTDVLFANTAGKVGIGTTSIPSDVALEVNGAIGTSRMGIGGTYNSTQVQGIWSIAPNYKISTADNDFGNQYGMVYAHTNAGTSGSSKPIAGWGHQIMLTSNGTRNISLSMSSGHAYFAGNVSIGSTSSGSYDLYVNGKIGTSGINEISDERFKKDIQPLEGSLDKLLQLQGVSYHWRQDEFPDRKFEEGKDIGVIAQEVEKIFPELVKTDDEGYKAVEYSHLVPVLIEAIKEQQATIESQKRELVTAQKQASMAQSDINKKHELEMQLMSSKIEQLSSSIEALLLNKEMTSK